MRFHPRIARVVKRRFGKLSRGVTAVEYALLLFLISIVMVPALIVLGPSIGSTFQKVTDGIGGKASSDPTADPTKPVTGKNVSCVEGSNDNGYFNNRYWSTGTDYYIDNGWAGDIVESPSSQVWVGREGYTDLTVADVLANGTADTSPEWSNYPFWSKTNNIATTASNPPDGIDPMYFQCLYGKDTPPVDPNDPNTCWDGTNVNGYFSNWYWSWNVDYTDPNSGLYTGTMTYNASNVTGAWAGEVIPGQPWYLEGLFSGRGALLRTERSRSWDSQTGESGAFTVLYYENGNAWAYDNDLGIYNPGPPPTVDQIEAWVSTLGFAPGWEIVQGPAHPHGGESGWFPSTETYPIPANYPSAAGTPGDPYFVSGSPDASSDGIQQAPPAGADLTCPGSGGGPIG